MISAKEAREIVDQSSAEVDRQLAKIEPLIKVAAEKGQRSVNLGLLTDFGVSVAPFDPTPKLSPLQERVKSALEREFGYRTVWEAVDEPYVPRGLADDDGHGPYYQNWALVVCW